MSGHSNKKIKQHVEDSKVLVDKMQKLTDSLQDALQKNFNQAMGIPLPSIMDTMVRETDIAMVYSTDPSIDEYINGARKLLGAAFEGEKIGVINGMLDLVDVIVSKIIGTAELQTGIHSTSAKTGDYITAAFSAVQKATAKDWLTSADFYVSYYVFVVFKPSVTQMPMLSESPMLGGALEDLDVAATVEIKEIATRNYSCCPL